jgi:hypothetical protein
MFKASWWKERGYSEDHKSPPKNSFKGIEGRSLSLSSRSRISPSMSSSLSFISLAKARTPFAICFEYSLIERRGIVLSEPAKKGYLRFYKEKEIEEKLNALGVALLETPLTSKDILGEVVRLLKA